MAKKRGKKTKKGRKTSTLSSEAASHLQNPNTMSEEEDQPSQSQDSTLCENQRSDLPPQVEGEGEGGAGGGGESDVATVCPPAPSAHDSDTQPQQLQEASSPPAAHDSNTPCQREEDPEGMSVSSPPSPIPVPPAHDSEAPSLQQQERKEQEEEEAQALSPTPPDLPLPAPAAHGSNPAPLFVTSRKPNKRKKAFTRKQLAAVQKKLRLLKENLQPIPFVPIKTLDFSAHEQLFKSLGLWDFAHLEFDRPMRSDLLSQLIATYNPTHRCSFVKDLRIMVNRADLARALKLPDKKDKTALPDLPLSDQQGFSDQSISIIAEFMSNYILLHEDTWIMPNEILASERLLKEGQLQKIDWAGLIWFMVKEEITQAPESGSCYYASHLQHLMKMQRPELFIEDDGAAEEVSDEDEEDAVAVQEQDLENHRVELSLGHDRNGGEQAMDDDVMGFQECKDEHGQWLLDGRINGNEQCLRHCNLNEVRSSNCERACKEDDEDGYAPSLKFSSLSRLTSTDLIQDMETTNGSYGIHADLLDPSSGELLRADVQKSTLPLNVGGLSMFGDACKQDSDDEDDVHNLSQVGQQRKMRNDGSWGDAPVGSFRMIMEQVVGGVDKARLLYEEKAQECMRVHMTNQYLNAELEQRDNIICSLEKGFLEERHKKDMEIFRLEQELCVMTQLLHGYKMALKNTRSAFAEYRELSKLPEEPVYKDVSGTGGFVLSVAELEKQRLEKEEEERVIRVAIEEKIRDFEQDWLGKFELYCRQVDSFDQKLAAAVEEIKLLKENHMT